MAIRIADTQTNFNAPNANYPDGSFKNASSPSATDGSTLDATWGNDLQGFLQALLTASGISASGSVETALSSQFLNAVKVVTGGAGLYQADIDYPVDSYAKGSDGAIYRADIANGPASTAVDPVADGTGTWLKAVPYSSNYEEAAGSAADVYVLETVAQALSPAAYFDGMQAEFVVVNSNTGASTVDVAGIGVKNLVSPGGASMAGGELVAGDFVGIRYDLGNDRFELVIGSIPATELTAGVIELATAAEAQAQTDDQRAITPAKLAAALQGANQSLIASGFQKLPGGLILNWGEFDTGSLGNNSTGTHVYPVAFPTSTLQVVVGSNIGVIDSGTAEGFSVTGSTLTGFSWLSQWQSRTDTLGMIRYLAIGV